MDIPRGTTQVGEYGTTTVNVMGSTPPTISTVSTTDNSSYHSGGYPMNANAPATTTSTATDSPDNTLLIIMAIAAAVALYFWFK